MKQSRRWLGFLLAVLCTAAFSIILHLFDVFWFDPWYFYPDCVDGFPPIITSSSPFHNNNNNNHNDAAAVTIGMTLHRSNPAYQLTFQQSGTNTHHPTHYSLLPIYLTIIYLSIYLSSPNLVTLFECRQQHTFASTRFRFQSSITLGTRSCRENHAHPTTTRSTSFPPSRRRLQFLLVNLRTFTTHQYLPFLQLQQRRVGQSRLPRIATPTTSNPLLYDRRTVLHPQHLYTHTALASCHL